MSPGIDAACINLSCSLNIFVSSLSKPTIKEPHTIMLFDWMRRTASSRSILVFWFSCHCQAEFPWVSMPTNTRRKFALFMRMRISSSREISIVNWQLEINPIVNGFDKAPDFNKSSNALLRFPKKLSSMMKMESAPSAYRLPDLCHYLFH